jgi:replicative DNA helicase
MARNGNYNKISPFPDTRREQYLERPLPSSEESERVILGGVLLDNTLFAEPVEVLKPEDFYSPLNRRIYSAMFSLFEQAKQIDPVLIIEEMKKDGPVDAIGGVSTIANLTYGLPHFSSLKDYIKTVKDKSNVRNLIRTCNQITSDALSEEEDAETVLDRAEQSVFSICERPDISQPEQVDHLADQELKEREEMVKNGVKFTGVSTGLADLDRDTGGFKKQELIITAGRPAMGKSSLGAQFAWAATDSGGVAAFFSLEMSKKQLIARFLCSEARVDLHRYLNGTLPQFDFRDVMQAKHAFNGRKLYIDDTAGITPMQVLSKCRRIYARHKRLDLVVVDYLHLMQSSRKSENRLQEVSQISRELKSIAKQLNVPVVAISQLSRSPEHRSPPRPIMSDLRESGTIEQDADVVLFVFREEYYHETEENRGLAEVIIAKQRNGPTGTVRTTFKREYTKFLDLYPGY